MLHCPKCNYDNELGRIFCHQCGTKLDLDQIKPPSRGGKSLAKKREFSAGKIVSWTVRLVILLGLVLVIFLMAQIPELPTVATTPRDLESFYRKRGNLENALSTRKTVSIPLTEAEVNAYVNNAGFDEPAGSGVKVVPTRLQVDFQDGQVTAYILGKIKVGGSWEKALCIAYTAVPRLEDGKLEFQPVTARFGKLPFPQWALTRTHFVQGYFEQLFHNLKPEQQLLQRLSTLTVEPDNALLEYKPEARPAQ